MSAHRWRRCAVLAVAAGLAGVLATAQTLTPSPTPGQAQATVPAPAASAASAPAPSMAIVGEWQGPFPGTKVVKLLDAQDGVACYFYLPESVPTQRVCDGTGACSVQYPGGVGTVSCVKVRDGVPAPAKAAPRR